MGSGSLRGALEGAFWGGITAGSARGIGHGFGANTLLADGSSVVPASPFGAGKWLVHGIAQGTISELRGGNFQSGFVGAVAGSVAGGASGRVMNSFGTSNLGTSTTVTAIFGGLASKASGGSFADGAVSAAFTHLFNDGKKSRFPSAKVILENFEFSEKGDKLSWGYCLSRVSICWGGQTRLLPKPKMR